MLETKKVDLWYEGESCLRRGWNVRSWLCVIKEIFFFATDGMLEGGLVVSRQIMFVLQTKC